MDASSLNAGISGVLGGYDPAVPGYSYVPGFGMTNTAVGIFKKANDSQTGTVENPANGGGATTDGAATEEEMKLLEACRNFEAIFLYKLLKIMRDAGPKGGILNESFATDLYRDMMDEKLALEMSKSGALGLADLLYEQTKPLITDTSTKEPDSADLD